MKNFSKRTFSLPLLASSLGSAASHLPTLARALLRPATSAALREKVMLGVTAVNDCRYCSYVHTGLALDNGVDLDELQALLDRGTFGSVDEREAVAILFAKHFADSVRQPSAAARRALAEKFSAAQQREIMAYIHAIYFANLAGNSADAWLARLQGQRVHNGHPFAEAAAALLAAPVLAGIALRSRNARPEAMKPL
jgi:AhpD family alkylhydroperoxidase